jgi:RimJ/RimL family protein N-acetyltransferase
MNRFLEGNRVCLRPVEKDDLKTFSEWVNDGEIRALIGEVYPMTEEGLEESYEKTQKTEDTIWLVIVDKEKDLVIGETGFLRIFYPWRTADFSIIIGKKEYWRKGIGKEVAGLMLEYGFNSLNFHRLSIGVVGFNERALTFWESIGFKEEGVQRDGYFHNGKYSDFIMMSLLEDEYRNRPSL